MQENCDKNLINFYGSYRNILIINTISCKCFVLLKILIPFYFQSTIRTTDVYMTLVVSCFGRIETYLKKFYYEKQGW
jgi:hypothetical protein